MAISGHSTLYYATNLDSSKSLLYLIKTLLFMPLSQTSTGSSRTPLTHLSATSGNNNETDGGRGGNFLFILGTTEMLPRTSISPSAHY